MELNHTFTFTGILFYARLHTSTSLQVKEGEYFGPLTLTLLCAIALSSSEDIRTEVGTLAVSLQLNIHISLLAVCGSAYRRDKGRVGGGRRGGGRWWRVHRQLTPERCCVFDAHLHSRLQGGGERCARLRRRGPVI